MKHEAYLRENFSAKELKLLSSLAVGLKKEVDQIDYGIFTEDEKKYLRDLQDTPSPGRGLRHHTFVIMKATRYCNLRCTYCHSWRSGAGQNMTFEVLAKTIRDVMLSTTAKRIEFVWHGGESTLVKQDFYTKAFLLQEHYRQDDVIVSNSMQTNGYNLSDDWIDFIESNRVSIGVSLDGPPEIHDSRRITVGGKGTSSKVQDTLKKFVSRGVEFGVLMVIDHDIVQLGVRRILEYLTSLDIKQVALLNVLPENPSGAEVNGAYLRFDDYMSFMIDLFDVWHAEFRESIQIRELDSLLDQVSGERPGICVFAGNCLGQFLTIDPNGDVSACDKYIDVEEYRFGNVLNSDLGYLSSQSENLLKSKSYIDTQTKTMSTCEHFNICHGGCPHDNFLNARFTGIENPECCGLKPLIRHIKTKVERKNNE